MILKTFVLVGVIDSFDAHFATVELNLNPSVNAGPAQAVMPVSAFPCTIREGQTFYVVKIDENTDPVVVCSIEDREI